MSQTANTEAYERLLSALTTFEKRNLEISSYLLDSVQFAKTALNNDNTCQTLEKKIRSITIKMLDISEKTELLKKSMQETLDAMYKLEREDQEE